MDMGLGGFQELVIGRPGMLRAVHGVAKSWTWLSNWTELYHLSRGHWYWQVPYENPLPGCLVSAPGPAHQQASCPRTPQSQVPWDTDKFTIRPRNINRWMDKEDVVHKNHGILLGHKKEWNLAICDMDRPRGYYAKWNKWVREREILGEFTCMWNLKNKTNEHTK